MPQVDWETSKREGRFRVGFGVGDINKSHPFGAGSNLRLYLTPDVGS